MGEGKMNSKNFRKIPNIKFTKLFINGEFVDSISGSSLINNYPPTFINFLLSPIFPSNLSNQYDLL